jgi:hypothetical protein
VFALMALLRNGLRISPTGCCRLMPKRQLDLDILEQRSREILYGRTLRLKVVESRTLYPGRQSQRAAMVDLP